MGGLLAAHLASLKETITVFDRGRQLAALKYNGLVLKHLDGSSITIDNLNVDDDLRACEPHDFVFLAVKAHQIESVAHDLPVLFHANTALVTLQNGIPWWYFQNYKGRFSGRIIETVDPGGTISAHIPVSHIVGCVSYPAAEVVAPGIIRHIEGVRFPIGELDGTHSERAKRISSLLIKAGFKAPIVDDIRSEIWLKAWGTLAFNPISTLTHTTMAQICRFEGTRGYAAKLMTEAQHVAERLGVSFRVPLERRLQGAEKVGEHKTSMLQDLEAGRTLEIEAILGAVIELAGMAEVDTPNLRSLYALTKLRDLTNRGDQP